MVFLHQGWAAFVLITLTLVLQAAGMAALIQWIKRSFPKALATWPIPFRCARGAIHQSAYLPAHAGDSVVGLVLSLEMLCNLGNGLLLFGGQLFDGRPIRRCFSQTNVANVGPGRKRYRCADVRTLRELPVCHCDPAHRTRRPGTGEPARPPLTQSAEPEAETGPHN